jgi:hypothetical protein
MKAYYDFLMGEGGYSRILQTTYTCFCPDLVNALKICSSNKDFVESIGDAINMKLKKIQNSNINVQNLVQEGHLARVFTKFLDNRNALNINLIY